jgi:hypothetical protein
MRWPLLGLFAGVVVALALVIWGMVLDPPSAKWSPEWDNSSYWLCLLSVLGVCGVANGYVGFGIGYLVGLVFKKHVKSNKVVAN